MSLRRCGHCPLKVAWALEKLVIEEDCPDAIHPRAGDAGSRGGAGVPPAALGRAAARCSE